ncbi:hypothetical protein, conserved [Babesia bigemina]|uniref:Uncharacterized protein n=1 Tax=Babesia bigemina TaxID=5866 RepID=A0A061D9C7_BABBI|nr:hypothetical protein, conserved [Babesia bigemina]CDR96597.1 hypothetical protein, conserved [Babesia bigemina]|eukprot:XP_012768783.1 hypothetical protein, conserved [Babesia bigemina]
MDPPDLAAALDCAVRDLDLLEESLCDLAVALGSSAETPQGSHHRHLQMGAGIMGFQGKTGSRRLRHFRKTFAQVEVPAPAFLRVLHLHLKRGAALLKRCPAYLDQDASAQAENRSSDNRPKGERPIVTSLEDVSGLPRESLLDIVEGRNVPIGAGLLERLPDSSRFASHNVELFCRCYMDAVLDLYHGVLKRVSTFDIFDCIRLRCFFVNMEHILASNGVRHTRLRNEIIWIVLQLMRFALQDAWWIRTDTEWLRTKLPFVCHGKAEAAPGEARLYELRDALNRVSTVSGQHCTLDVRIFRDISRLFGLPQGAGDMWEQLMGGVEEPSEQPDDYIMFKKVVGESKNTWVDVIVAAIVAVANTVLFECFVRQIEALPAPNTITGAASRLEMLNGLVELLHETDFGYTAWAVDLLGPRADPGLLTAFRIHGELLLKGDSTPNGPPLKRLDWGEGILVYVGTLKRINHIFHKEVVAFVDRIAAPVLEVMGKRGGKKLWWELLYSEDKLLVGPGGEVGDVVRGCNKRIRDALCAELFARIIAKFGQAVASGMFNSEQTVFNALALWDSFCSLNLGKADVHNNNYHINKLFEMVEKIKMGNVVSPTEPMECLDDFWAPLLSSERSVTGRRYPPIDLSHYIHREMEGRVGPDNYVWVGGTLRKRLAIFGNVLLMFRDDSALQPIGMVDMADVVAVNSLDDEDNADKQQYMSDTDADLYSCGTTDSEPSEVENEHANFDMTVLHWGWRLRIKVGGSDALMQREVQYIGVERSRVIDLEFMGPEHRERWLRSLKLIHTHQAYRKPLWWPMHSAFFTDRYQNFSSHVK